MLTSTATLCGFAFAARAGWTTWYSSLISGYNGNGLRPEEYAVLVIIADYQQKLARAA